MIPVTKPFLPPIEEYENFIRQIWERNWLTNNGPLVNELELKLKQEIDSIETIDALRAYYEKNKGRGKEFDKYISIRKQQLTSSPSQK